MPGPTRAQVQAGGSEHEIRRLKDFLLNLDRYWQRARRNGADPETIRRLERYLVVAASQLQELTTEPR